MRRQKQNLIVRQILTSVTVNRKNINYGRGRRNVTDDSAEIMPQKIAARTGGMGIAGPGPRR
jgi:hypothetical protein